MEDITKLLIKAKIASTEWKDDVISKTITIITESFVDLIIDWDKDSGESWIRIIKNNEVIGFIRVDFPLLIINTKFEAELLELKDRINCKILIVTDFNNKNFSIKVDAFNQVFELNKTSEAINLNRFSINELWYETV